VEREKKFLAGFLILGSILVGCFELFLYISGLENPGAVSFTWKVIFIILLIIWLDLDSRPRPDIYRPFEFGFLIFVFWPVYLPYYLAKTRKIKAFIILPVLLALLFLGDLLQLICRLLADR